MIRPPTDESGPSQVDLLNYQWTLSFQGSCSRSADLGPLIKQECALSLLN